MSEKENIYSTLNAGEARVALFAGSFDPFTRGHKDIVDRALRLFDKVIVCVGVNAAKLAADPHLRDTIESRASAIAAVYRDQPRVEAIVSDELTVDTARRTGARYLLRGVRSVRDFEYERDMADLNARLAPDIETVVLFSAPELSCISSSAVRDIASHGGDINSFLP